MQSSLDKGGSRKRLILWAAIALIGVLALAWFDGGEEPIHPIEVQVSMPEGR